MVNLITQRSNQNPTTKYNVIEADPMSFFDAESDMDSTFMEETSEAGGLKRMVKHRRKIKNQKQKRRDLKARDTGIAKKQRTNAKQTQARSQRDAAKAMGKQDDSAMANALAASAPVIDAPKSNKGLVIGGIIAGVVVVGGLIALVIYKSRK